MSSAKLVNTHFIRLTRLKSLGSTALLDCAVKFRRRGVSISMSNTAEGFERTHLQEKIQFYNVARGSAGEVRSLLYVISDNFTDATAEAERLRDEVTTVGKLVTGLLTARLSGTPRYRPTCDPR